MFDIALTKFYWIDGGLDDPDDLCLHGNVAVSIGDECFETSCTVSAAALYFLKTLTEKHIAGEDNQLFPCCGHFYIPNDANDTVLISGCPHGIDWTVVSVGGKFEVTTKQEMKILIEKEAYTKTVFNFVDEVRFAYEKSAPKHIPKDDFEKAGYIAFWNEWARRRNNSKSSYFCPAVSRTIDEGLCWEYCFAEGAGPTDTAEKLKKWIADTRICKNIKDFHTVCKICTHCKWTK